jgi:putative ABC transport system ATP-binding protein
MNKIIVGKNITKAFGEGAEKRNVLDGVFVDITKGEFVCIMGPSGSGKSTLLYCLSGMEEIDGGEVMFEGKELSSFKEEELADLRRTRMGLVFQQPTMLKNLNMLDNMILPSVRDNKKEMRYLVKKAKELMKKTGIEALENRSITQVSGGQLQRAGICRALMNQPSILFGDEPTGSLNSKSAQEIMQLFLQIWEEGTTVLLVTHDAKVAAQSERVLFMSDGKIASELKLSKYSDTQLEERVLEVSKEMQKLGI